MKANRKFIINKKGVAPTLTMLLVIPIILMVISAIALWAQNFIGTLQDLQNEINDKRELLESLDVGNLVNSSNIIHIDTFEDYKEDKPQWNTKTANGASPIVVGPETEANQSYYTGSLGGYINLGSSGNGFSSISRSFENKCYGLVSIELAFTISPDETYKIFSIYQNNQINNGTIKIDIQNKKLFYSTDTGFSEFASDVNLYADELCWHTMKLIVDFEKLEYVNFTLDGTTYDLSSHELTNIDKTVSKNPDTMTVKYSCSGSGETWVDDFVLSNLNPYKDIKIKWV